jgi:hypothetical protein
VEFSPALVGAGDYTVTLEWQGRSASCTFRLPLEGSTPVRCDEPLGAGWGNGELGSVYLYEDDPAALRLSVTRKGANRLERDLRPSYDNRDNACTQPCRHARDVVSLEE